MNNKFGLLKAMPFDLPLLVDFAANTDLLRAHHMYYPLHPDELGAIAHEAGRYGYVETIAWIVQVVEDQRAQLSIRKPDGWRSSEDLLEADNDLRKILARGLAATRPHQGLAIIDLIRPHMAEEDWDCALGVWCRHPLFTPDLLDKMLSLAPEGCAKYDMLFTWALSGNNRELCEYLSAKCPTLPEDALSIGWFKFLLDTRAADLVDSPHALGALYFTTQSRDADRHEGMLGCVPAGEDVRHVVHAGTAAAGVVHSNICQETAPTAHKYAKMNGHIDIANQIKYEFGLPDEDD